MKTMQRNVAFDLRLPQRPLSPPTPNSSLSDRHSAATISFLAYTSRTGHKLMDSNENNAAFLLCSPRRLSSPPTPKFSLSDGHSATTIGFPAYTTRIGPKPMDSN